MQFSKDIVAIGRYFRRCRNVYMENFGLKGIHARYLMEVSQTPGVSQDKLSQRLGVDKSNVARQVAMLEDNAFLLRKPSKEDKRVLCLYPTDKSLALLPDLQEAMEGWENAALSSLDPQERAQLLSLMNKMRQWTERSGME